MELAHSLTPSSIYQAMIPFSVNDKGISLLSDFYSLLIEGYLCGDGWLERTSTSSFNSRTVYFIYHANKSYMHSLMPIYPPFSAFPSSKKMYGEGMWLCHVEMSGAHGLGLRT